MHKGRDCWGRQGKFEHSFNALDNQEWDLCMLQEVNGQDLMEFAQRRGYGVCYGYTRASRGAHYGNAVLSRQASISLVENVDISAHLVESRRALICSVEIGGEKPFICVSTHFGLKKKWRERQGHGLISGIGSAADLNAGSVIIGGDFNDHGQDLRRFMIGHGFSDGADVARGRGSEHRPKTFPAQMPLLALDNIFAKGFHQEKVSLLAPHANWRQWSDHLPLSMRVTL